MGVNKVILVGRLGKDPELRYTNSQTAVANFSLATGERRRDADGNWTEHTEWHTVVVFGKTAENCSNFLKKGREIYLEGRIQTRKWQDKEGKDRYTTEIIATQVQFLGGKGDGMGVTTERSAANDMVASMPSADAIAASSSSNEVSFDDDDIPF